MARLDFGGDIYLANVRLHVCVMYSCVILEILTIDGRIIAAIAGETVFRVLRHVFAKAQLVLEPGMGERWLKYGFWEIVGISYNL